MFRKPSSSRNFAVLSAERDRRGFESSDGRQRGPQRHKVSRPSTVSSAFTHTIPETPAPIITIRLSAFGLAILGQPQAGRMVPDVCRWGTRRSGGRLQDV